MDDNKRRFKWERVVEGMALYYINNLEQQGDEVTSVVVEDVEGTLRITIKTNKKRPPK